MTKPLTVIKQLPAPWTVGAQTATEIELREPLLEDLLEAEKEANPGAQPNAFNVALAARTMVRAGKFTGPFTPGQFKAMKPRTWYAIREAMQEAEGMGEGEQPSQAQPS
jgi:phage FluMu protein gp41